MPFNIFHTFFGEILDLQHIDRYYWHRNIIYFRQIENISIFDILKRVEVIKNSRTIGIRYSYTYTTSWSGFYAYSVRRQTCMHRVQGVINNNRKLKWIYAPCRQKTLRVNLVCLQNQHRQNKSYKLSIKLHRVRR